MSMGAHDVFALVVNFIDIDEQPKHVTIMLFKATKIIDQIKVMKLKAFMDKHDLWKNILAYVKNEGSNLGAMTTTLKSMVSCDN